MDKKLKAERTALADAIAARDKAAGVVADNRAKIAQFEAAAAEAREAEAIARRRVETAASDRIQRLVDGLPSDADPGLRVALEVAQENVEVTREAVRILKERLSPFDAQYARACQAVTAAVNSLLSAIVGDLLAETEVLRVAHEEKRCVLASLKDRLYDRGTLNQAAPCAALEEYLGRTPFPLELGRIPFPESHPAYAAWSLAAEALERDPNAPLPA